MLKDNVSELKKPESFIDDPITDILRSVARKLLAQALETEIKILKSIWQEDLDKRRKRDLSHKRYVYIWADDIYFNVRIFIKS